MLYEIWKVRFTAYILTAINIEVRAVIDIIFGSLGKIFYFYASIVAAFRKSIYALVCFTLNMFSKISFTFDKVLKCLICYLKDLEKQGDLRDCWVLLAVPQLWNMAQ